MTFRRGVRLKPGQVRDLRGKGGLALGGGLGGVILLVAILLLGGDPSQIPADALNGITVGTGQDNSQIEQECRTGEDANQRQDCRMVGFVNAIQDYWSDTFDGYELAPTTFFTGQVSTGCGSASSAVGPFYCPQDRNVYIDLGFFDQLESQLGAEGGPLAEAYVLAHEYGHHVQNLTGVLRGGGGNTGAESRAVRTELQADCYAGAFINHAEERYLEPITPRAAGAGAGRRRGGRRRPHPGADPGPGRPGDVDTWFLRATPTVVFGRLGVRRPEPVRYIQR